MKQAVPYALIIISFVMLSSFLLWPLDNLYFNKIMMESWEYAGDIFKCKSIIKKSPKKRPPVESEVWTYYFVNYIYIQNTKDV